MSEENYEYEKVVDDIYWMGPNTILKFNVVLARADNNGYRKLFHQEYKYQSKKYKDQENLVTIKRRYDYFLSIETNKSYGDSDREYIIVGVQDFPYFREKLKEASLWLTNSDIYRFKDNNIIMIGSVEPIIINFTAWNKTITLEPIVIRSDIGLNCAGIRITLGKNRDNFCDMSVDVYMGFLYVVSSFNMQMAAMSVLSYMGRPSVVPYEVNSFEQESPRKSNQNGQPGRFIGINKSNDLDDL